MIKEKNNNNIIKKKKKKKRLKKKLIKIMTNLFIKMNQKLYIK